MKTNNMEYQEFDVQKKILHEDFEEKKDQYINDIAIVRVKTDGNRGIRFSSHGRLSYMPAFSAYFLQTRSELHHYWVGFFNESTWLQ